MGDTKEYDPKEETEGGFARFLWNPETKQLCGRTLSSWGM